MPVLEKKLAGATLLVMKVVSIGKPGAKKGKNLPSFELTFYLC